MHCQSGSRGSARFGGYTGRSTQGLASGAVDGRRVRLGPVRVIVTGNGFVADLGDSVRCDPHLAQEGGAGEGRQADGSDIESARVP